MASCGSSTSSTSAVLGELTAPPEPRGAAEKPTTMYVAAPLGLSIDRSSAVVRYGLWLFGRTPRVLVSITELNEVGVDAFADALKPLFEAAGPLADALYAQRPFMSYLELVDRADSIASSLPDAQQTEIVNAHPR